MTFITFIYRVNYRDTNPRTFYGKYYTDYVAHDQEGLVEKVKLHLVKGLKAYQLQKNRQEFTQAVHIGVLSLSSHIYMPDHETNDEKNCFDFYCENYANKQHLKTYVFGTLVE